MQGARLTSSQLVDCWRVRDESTVVLMKEASQTGSISFPSGLGVKRSHFSARFIQTGGNVTHAIDRHDINESVHVAFMLLSSWP